MSEGVNGDGFGTNPRNGGGRWAGSGVAAMRAEHEAEMTALKEEKQDLLLKYHAISSKLNEQERLCAELNKEVEENRKQAVSLEVGCVRSCCPQARLRMRSCLVFRLDLVVL